MLRGFFSKLIFAIIARILYGNHLNSLVLIVALRHLTIPFKIGSLCARACAAIIVSWSSFHLIVESKFAVALILHIK